MHSCLTQQSLAPLRDAAQRGSRLVCAVTRHPHSHSTFTHEAASPALLAGGRKRGWQGHRLPWMPLLPILQATRRVASSLFLGEREGQGGADSAAAIVIMGHTQECHPPS